MLPLQKKAIHSFEMGNINPMAECHIPENLNPQELWKPQISYMHVVIVGLKIQLIHFPQNPQYK
jgi:hypothetical protein